MPKGWLVAISLIGSLPGCATASAPQIQRIGGPPSRERLACTAPVRDWKAQRAETERALRGVNTQHEAVLEQADHTTSAQDEDDLEALMRAYNGARRRVLAPLAARGNAEAMMRLAQDLRDSSTREDIAQWFRLANCASRLNHPEAHDELVRFFWHQRGDGSIAYVQKSRAIALSYAGKAAAAGNVFGLARIATYIAGNVHQYPADLPLAHRLLELCARADGDPCQQRLVARMPYDYSEDPVSAHLWLSRLAARHPESFAAQRDMVWDKLTPNERAAAERAEMTWRAATWAELKSEWREIQDQILLKGLASIGADTVCATQTPWCRGEGIIP